MVSVGCVVLCPGCIPRMLGLPMVYVIKDVLDEVAPVQPVVDPLLRLQLEICHR